MDSNIFVCQLSQNKQEKIKRLVTKYFKKRNYNDEEIKEIITSVMENRLWNVEEVINIQQFLV